MQTGCGNEQVEVTHGLAQLTELASFPPKDPTDRFIYADDINISQEVLEGLLVTLWVAGIVDPLVQLGQGDETLSATPEVRALSTSSTMSVRPLR